MKTRRQTHRSDATSHPAPKFGTYHHGQARLKIYDAIIARWKALDLPELQPDIDDLQKYRDWLESQWALAGLRRPEVRKRNAERNAERRTR